MPPRAADTTMPSRTTTANTPADVTPDVLNTDGRKALLTKIAFQGVWVDQLGKRLAARRQLLRAARKAEADSWRTFAKHARRARRRALAAGDEDGAALQTAQGRLALRRAGEITARLDDPGEDREMRGLAGALADVRRELAGWVAYWLAFISRDLNDLLDWVKRGGLGQVMTAAMLPMVGLARTT